MWEKIKNSRFANHLRNSRAAYITILTLVLAMSVLITVTAISNRAKKKDTQTPNNPPAQSDGSQNPDSGSDGTSNTQKDPGTGVDKDKLPPVPSQDGSTDAKPENDPSSDTGSTLPELSLPVSGVIAKGYDSALQVYSATMGDYRIHLGLDMTTAEDAPVYAAADGVISRIWDDALMGKCVAVSHAGECYTIYKNLDPELPESVTVGAEIKVGALLGNVGESAVIELAEEPHLHFEMTVQGLSVDPLEYFSEQAIALLQKDTSHETSATPEEE